MLGSGPSMSNIQKLDHGATPMLIDMMTHGIPVDLSHFEALEKVLAQDMEDLTESVRILVGQYVNLDSGDQVSALLFKKLGLKQPRIRMTKSGDRESVDNEALVAIAHDHECVPLVIKYKELSKLLGTYVRPMPKLARKVGLGKWRMFPNLGHTRIPSGRYNCKNPNLLAIPTRTERGQDIRKGFIAEDGWCFVSVDFSQIEVRMAAHYSGDPGLIEVYLTEQDLYSDFATMAYQLEDKRYKDPAGTWKYPTVDKNLHRFPAKTCILAGIYDVTAKGLLEQMPTIFHNGVPVWTEEKCQGLINSFYLKYPGIISDRKIHHSRARKYAYVWCLWGRLLHTAAVRSVHPWVQSAALREAGNFPYQSGAGGLLKLSMAQIQNDIESMADVVHPTLPIHDELLLRCREDMAQDVIELVKYRFETCAPLRVPIKAGGAKAHTWGHLDK